MVWTAMAAPIRFGRGSPARTPTTSPSNWPISNPARARTRSWPAWRRRYRRRTKNIGAHYASLKPKAGAAKSAELAKLGEKLYRGGNAKTGVSACMSCHGPSGHGIPPRYPRVSAQSAAYIEKQMLAFKSGARANDGDIMTRIAFRMSEHEIRSVADYMAGLH